MQKRHFRRLPIKHIRNQLSKFLPHLTTHSLGHRAERPRMVSTRSEKPESVPPSALEDIGKRKRGALDTGSDGRPTRTRRVTDEATKRIHSGIAAGLGYVQGLASENARLNEELRARDRRIDDLEAQLSGARKRAQAAGRT
jgi:hypothetical protein